MVREATVLELKPSRSSLSGIEAKQAQTVSLCIRVNLRTAKQTCFALA